MPNVRTPDRVATPAHLPPPIPAGDAFAALYAQFARTGMHFIDADQERRIPSDLAPEEVYRRLPTAPDFEYSGYLTRTRIRYSAGRPVDCDAFHDKACAFHTHPTEHAHADVPSLQDLYSFLRGPVRRSITVGRSAIWCWDKEPGALPALRQLLAWEEQHMVRCMQECAKRAQPGERFSDRYRQIALAQFGLEQRLLNCEVSGWSAVLQQTLGLKTFSCRR